MHERKTSDYRLNLRDNTIGMLPESTSNRNATRNARIPLSRWTVQVTDSPNARPTIASKSRIVDTASSLNNRSELGNIRRVPAVQLLGELTIRT
jgi:hypothetical protein